MRTTALATAAWLVLSAWFAGAESTRTIFISVTDGSGRAVTDLKPSEVAVGEDGVRFEMTGFRLASAPLSIALLADTTGGAEQFVQDFRRSLTSFVRFVQTAVLDTEIMLMEFGQAAVPLTEFTTSTVTLERPLARLYPKRNAPSVLLEAIGESSRLLGLRTNRRRAIVILNIEPANEQSAWRPNQVVEALRKSGASVWAVSLQNGALRNAPTDVVLPVLGQNTGGMRDFILAPSAIEPKLLQIAEALVGQYEVSYIRPPTERTPKLVTVRVGRPGLTIRAPAWPPQ